jgi:hypothetical protein
MVRCAIDPKNCRNGRKPLKPNTVYLSASGLLKAGNLGRQAPFEKMDVTYRLIGVEQNVSLLEFDWLELGAKPLRIFIRKTRQELVPCLRHLLPPFEIDTRRHIADASDIQR